MPSLFGGRKSRSVSASRPAPPVSNSAQSAAAQAFLANRASHSNLSASAAAAALRTMSPTPTPVDQLQTKRMVNRQSSNASSSAAPRGRPRGTVQRRSSSGSMTERTFRGPSPARPASVAGPTVYSTQQEGPPVPRLPEQYTDVPPVPKKSNRRSSSLEAYSTRVASPVSNKPAAGYLSSHQQATQTTAGAPAATAARRVASLQQIPELERSDSTNSINFSYPRGARPNSPPPSSPTSPVDTNRSSTQGGISQMQRHKVENDLQQAAQQPVKKKKKRVDRSAAEGSHLQAGSMGGKPKTAPLEPGPATAAEDMSQGRTPDEKAKKKKAALTGQASHFPPNQVSADTTSADSDPESVSDLTRERNTQRAAGVLAKQPSVVREDWEGEQSEEKHSPGTSKTTQSTAGSTTVKRPTSEANVSRKIEEPASAPKSSYVHSQQMPTSVPTSGKRATGSSQNLTTGVNTMHTRGTSLSPSRSTRFSSHLSSDITVGGKHEPLPRASSPAKSALKHHSPARVSTSLLSSQAHKKRESSLSPSEGTDVSTEEVGRRKRPNHVSFDTQPEVVGTAAEPVLPASPAIASPQNRDSAKSRFSFKSVVPTSSSDQVEDEGDESMQPRPQLPTFGSVRKPRFDDYAADKGVDRTSARSSTNSSLSSDYTPATAQTSVSSDHAVGGVPRDGQQKAGQRNAGEEQIAWEDAKPVPAQRSERLTSSTHGAITHVPSIEVQPATPAPENANKPSDQWLVEVPGGFPAAFDASHPAQMPGQTTRQADRGSVEPPSIYAEYTTPVASKPYSTIGNLIYADAEDRVSDDESIYSDAAEDLSDLEGDGFGSIDAIMGKPVPPSPTAQRSVVPESPLDEVRPARARIQEKDRTTSWDDTQAHWSGVAELLKKGSQSPSQEYAQPIVSPPSQTVGRNLSTEDGASGGPTRTVATSAGTGPGLGSSARVSSQSLTSPVVSKKTPKTDKGGFRKSMRADTDAETVQTPRPQTSTVTDRKPEQETPRKAIKTPATAVPAAQEPRAALQKKHIPPATKPRPPPVAANDSDSESSFRKGRRSKNTNDGRYSMKRSMRAPASDSQPVSVPAGRGGVRSLSPIARRPLSPVGGSSTMRSTMRSSMDAGTRTLRGPPQQQQQRPASLFGRSSKPKPEPRARPASAVVAPKTKSRFADSDDEDGPRPAVYSSRFADSSDEETDLRDLRPVRGIPRQANQGDSTDLEDSSDEDARRTKKAAPPKKLEIQIPSSPPVTSDGPSSPTSPTSKKKRGLFGRFKKGKDGEMAENEKPNVNETIQARNAKAGGKEGVGKRKPTDLGFTSKAEQEAAVEAMRRRLEASSDRPTSPVRGKLQRRVTPQRVLSDSWSPPPKVPTGANDRPVTSDGTKADSTTRPGVGDRQPTSETLLTTKGSPVLGKSGKKKRFPLLRKAFGLSN